MAPIHHHIATALFDGLSDPVVVVDCRKQITAVNAAACAQFGYHEDELAGRPAEMLYASREDYDRCIGKRQDDPSGSIDTQNMFKRKNGSTFVARLRSTPFRLDDGTLGGFVGVVRDISEHIERDAERRRLRGLLNTALEAIPEGFAVFDRNENLVLFNEAYRKFSGPVGETFRPGMNVTDIMDAIFRSGHYPDARPEDPDSEAWIAVRLEEFRRADGTGRVFRYADGRWLRAENIRTGDGNIVALRIDVTDMKETELAFNRQRLEYVTLVQNLPDFVTRISRGKRFTYVNDHYADFMGVPAEQIVGQPILDFVPRENGGRVLAILNALSPEAPMRIDEQWAVMPGGRDVCIQWSNMAIYDGETLVEFISVGRDITQLKRQQERIEQQRIELKHKNDALDQFTGTVSHDLKAPLRHLSMFSEMIDEDIRNGELGDIRTYASHLRQGARRMERLISSLLDYSQIAYEINHWKNVPLNRIIAETIASLNVQATEAEARFEVEQLPVVRGDPELLKRLAENLIGNAVKYHKPGVPPVIRIYGREDAGAAILIVEDNGIGIAPHFAVKIFDVFQRLHRDESVYPGTGIGLSLAKRIVESHNGTIELDTSMRAGARFIISFPKTEPGNREKRVS